MNSIVPKAATTARAAVVFPKEPTTVTTRVLRPSVNLWSVAKRERRGHA